MTEEQINETFDSLFSAIRQPVNNTPAPKEPDPPKVPTKEELRDRFDPSSERFDPEGAIRDLTNANYGGLIDDLGRKANAGMKAELRRTLPDFDKHEADIDKVLENVPPNQINQQVLANTYFSVLGAKEAARIQKERTKPPTTTTPSTQRQETEKPQLSDEERQVAKVMFRGSADPEKAYLEAQEKFEKGYQVRVPGDK